MMPSEIAIRTNEMAILTRSPTRSARCPAGIITTIMAIPKTLFITPICPIVSPAISSMKTDRNEKDILKKMSRTPSVTRIQVNSPPATIRLRMAPRFCLSPVNDRGTGLKSAPFAASRAMPRRRMVARMYSPAATINIPLKLMPSTR